VRAGRTRNVLRLKPERVTLPPGLGYSFNRMTSDDSTVRSLWRCIEQPGDCRSLIVARVRKEALTRINTVGLFRLHFVSGPGDDADSPRTFQDRVLDIVEAQQTLM